MCSFSFQYFSQHSLFQHIQNMEKQEAKKKKKKTKKKPKSEAACKKMLKPE